MVQVSLIFTKDTLEPITMQLRSTRMLTILLDYYGYEGFAMINMRGISRKSSYYIVVHHANLQRLIYRYQRL